MLVAMVAHCGMLLDRPDALGHAARFILAPAFVCAASWGLLRPQHRGACLTAAFAATTLWLVLAFPVFANHLFLEWSVLLFLVLCRREPALALQAIRWLVLFVFFYSGGQKFWSGHYFAGEFLSLQIASAESFRLLFSWFVDPKEIARLVELAGATGTGPYTSRSPVLIVMSNAVWIGEAVLPCFLCWPRTRRFALFGALGLLIGIELGAREIVFGGLFTALLLLFFPGRNALRYWPALSVLQIGALIASTLEPGWGLN